MRNRQQTALLDFLRQFMLVPVMSQRGVLVSIVLSLALLSLTQAMFLVLIKGFLAAFFTDTSAEMLSIAGILPDKATQWFPHLSEVVLRRSDVVIYVPVAILIAGFFKASASYFYNLGLVRLSLSVAQNYREKVFEAVVSLPWLASSRRGAGEWMSVIMADAVFIQSRLSDFSTAFVKDGVLIISCLATLAFIHWPAALVLMLIAPVIGWQMGRAGKRISFFTEAFQKELGLLSGQLLGIRERFRFMRAQHGESFERGQFETRNKSYLKMMNNSIFLRAIVAPGMEWIGFLIFAGFIYAWTRKVPGFAVEPDIAIQFFVALGLILKPVREMGEQVARWSETVGGLRRSMDVFQEVSKVEGSDRPVVGQRQLTQNVQLPDLIELRRVEVSYDSRVAFSAKDLSLTRGKSVAIIGPSGSGKSTIIKCLSGLISPYNWDGNIAWDSFIGCTALVSQQPFLFKDSLLKNLTYGLSPDRLKSLTEENVRAVLSTVNLDQWLVGLNGSLSAEFNPVQTNVSGGQIQRLVIARALLRASDILLLDEATSAVDAATEQDISERLIKKVRDQRGVLLAVTHRLRWLELFDEVWFVENGRVEFKGKHGALLSHDRYRAFCAKGEES